MDAHVHALPLQNPMGSLLICHHVLSWCKILYESPDYSVIYHLYYDSYTLTQTKALLLSQRDLYLDAKVYSKASPH